MAPLISEFPANEYESVVDAGSTSHKTADVKTQPALDPHSSYLE